MSTCGRIGAITMPLVIFQINSFGYNYLLIFFIIFIIISVGLELFINYEYYDAMDKNYK